MRRTRLGLGAAATATALGLLVGGCGSSDSDSGDSASHGKSSGDSGGKSAHPPDDGGPGGGDGGPSGGDTGGSGSPGGPKAKPDVAPYVGSWASGTESKGDKLQILMFQKDATVSLAGQDLACQGTLKAAAKPAKLAMECQNDSDAYASGTVTDIDDEKLSVKWASGETATFRKGADSVGPPGQ